MSRWDDSPAWLRFGVAMLLVGAAAWLDMIVFDGIDLSFLYLPGVAFAAWYLGAPAAGICVGASSGLRLEIGGGWPANSAVLAQCLFLVAFAAVLLRLRASKRRERHLARSDFLTGLANGTCFMESAEWELEKLRETADPLSVAFMDCDNFKAINDELGHPAGDEVLRQVASAVQQCDGKKLFTARMGGDEFAVLLGGTNTEQARTICEQIRSQLHQVMQEHSWPVTFSIGVVTFLEAPESVAEMIREADNAMYAVKRASKDAIEFRTFPQIDDIKE